MSGSYLVNWPSPRAGLKAWIVGLALSAVFLSAPAWAATVTWTGGGSSNNWSDTANWSGNAVPGSTDLATFDGTSVKNATINVNVNVAGIAINAGYTGVITQAAGFTVTVGSSNFNQLAGAFAGSNSAITVNGAFVLSGGTFTSTSSTLSVTSDFTLSPGGTFFHNSGTVTFSTSTATIDVPTSESFNNLTFTSGTKTVAPGDALVVSGLLTLTGGSVSGSGGIEAQGNITQGSGFNGGTATLLINGGGAQTLTGGGSISNGDLPILTINKPSGTLTLASTIRTTNNWTYTAGTLDAGGSTVVFAISGAGNTQTLSGSHTLNDVRLTASGHKAIASGTTLAVNGTLTLTDGFMDTGTLEAKGNLTQASTFDGGTGILLIDGGGNQTFTGTAVAAGTLPPVTINKPGGTLTLAGTIRTANDWTYTAGTLDAGSSTVVFAISGAGNTQTLSGSHTLNDVQLAASGHKAIASGTTLTVNGTLTLTDGFMDTGTIQAKNNLAQASTFDGGSGILLINGGGNQTFTGTATVTAGTLPPVTINKPGGTLTLAGTIRTANDWTYTAGTLDAGSSTVVFAISGAGNTQTLSGSHTLNDVQLAASGHKAIASGTTLTVNGTLTLTDGFMDTGTIQAKGNLAQASTFDGGTGTLLINGSGAQTLTGGGSISAGDLPNLTVNKPSGTLTLASTIRTTKNWTYTVGTLDPGSSTVVFAGPLIISGSHTLNAVEIRGAATVSGATTLTLNSTLTMPSSVTFTVDGTVLVNGTVSLTNGSIAGTGNVQAQGNVTQATGFGGGSGNIVINGSGAQTLTGAGSTSAGDLPNLTVNKPSGTLTLASTIRTTKNWTYTAGTLDAGGSTVVFAISGTGNTQTLSGSHTLNNVQLTASGHKAIASGTTLTVNGTLTLTNGYLDTGVLAAQGNISQTSSFDGGTGTLLINGSGAQTLTGGGSVTSGSLPSITINKPSGALTLSGIIRTGSNWIYDSGTVDPAGSTVVFAGTTSQAIGGTIATTFDNFTVNNASGVALLQGPFTVTGTLDFVVGTISTGLSKVIVGSTGNLTRTSGHVFGNLQKDVVAGASVSVTFEIGDASNYMPTVVSFGNVTTAGNLTVGLAVGDHPDLANSGLEQAKTVNLYWTLTNSSIVFDTYDTTFEFVAGVLKPGADSNIFIVSKRDATWLRPAVSARTATSIQATGMTDFSDFVVGEPAPGTAISIAITSGNNQTGALSTALANPLIVTVTDVAGSPVSGTNVTFAVGSAPAGALGQSVSVTTATTNAMGQASTVLTLGNTVGSYTVTAASTGLSGSPVTFTAAAALLNGVPVITGLNPTSVTAGSPGFTLRIGGSNFVSGAVVRWNDNDKPTAFLSSTQLTAVIPASDVATPRTARVTVFNPAPGGGASNARAFSVKDPNPVPTITSLAPASVTVGRTSFILTIYGSNFVAGSMARWNGNDKPTTFLSSTQLTAIIPASDVVTPGEASVTVFNPGSSGGAESNSQAFAITENAPPVGLTPSFLYLNPSTVAGGGSSMGTVALNAPAPPGGVFVHLSLNNPDIATLPSIVKVPEGSGHVDFVITTGQVEKTVSIVVSGSFNGKIRTASLVIADSLQDDGSASTFFVPIVLSATGLNGSFYTSELSLTNRGSKTAVVEFNFVPAFGGGGGTASDILPAGAQRIFPDSIAYLKSIGVPIPDMGNRGGTLRVRFRGLSAPSAGNVLVRTTTVVQNGRAGLAYQGLITSEELAGTSYLCGLRQNAMDRSNVALQNAGEPSDGDIVLRLTVFSGDPDNPFSLALPDETLSPGEFKQITGILSSNGMSLSNGYVRIERVSGTAPYYAYAVINDQITSDGSFISPHPEGVLAGQTGLILPVIVENAGYVTELVLTNFSGVTKTLQFSYVADAIHNQKANAAATFSITLKPGQQTSYLSLVQTLRESGVIGIGPPGQPYVGPLFIKMLEGDADGIFLGARTSTTGKSRYGVFYTSVPMAQTATSTAWMHGLQQTPESRTNLALVNTGEIDEGPDVFRIELFDGDTGENVFTLEEVQVAAKQWKQIDSILAYAPGVKNGYARISRTSGSNPFLAYAVINDGERPGLGTDDGSYVPMKPTP